MVCSSSPPSSTVKGQHDPHNTRRPGDHLLLFSGVLVNCEGFKSHRDVTKKTSVIAESVAATDC